MSCDRTKVRVIGAILIMTTTMIFGSATTAAATVDCAQWYSPGDDEVVAPYKVTADRDTPLRRAPDPDPTCERGSTVAAGTDISVHAERDDWRYIYNPFVDGWGWIQASAIKVHVTEPDVTDSNDDPEDGAVDSSTDAANRSTARRQVVLIGDSYISGTGSDDAVGECKRSETTWATQWASLLGGDSVAVTNAACNGHTIGQIDGQLTEIPRAASLVMVTAGGNDLGFGDIARTCFTPLGSCRSAIDDANTSLPDVENRLTELLSDIADTAPEAQVAVVGYPHLIDAHQQPYTKGDYDAEQRLRELADRGEAMQIRAVQEANRAAGRAFATFISVKPAVDDHAPPPSADYDPIQEPWIHGIKIAGIEKSLHYNQVGHDKLARYLADCLALDGASDCATADRAGTRAASSDGATRVGCGRGAVSGVNADHRPEPFTVGPANFPTVKEVIRSSSSRLLAAGTAINRHLCAGR